MATNTAIRTFRHALALDERRVKFTPNFYHSTPDEEPDEATGGIAEITSDVHALNLTNKLPNDGTFASGAKFIEAQAQGPRL